MQRLPPRARNGFTLVEMMVVIVLVGLMSAVVVLAIPDPRGNLVEEAERLAARLAAARNDAIVQGRAIRMTIDATGYAVERRTGGRWLPAADKLFAPIAWKTGTQPVLSAAAPIRVSFDPTGGVSEPTTVALERDRATAQVAIDSDGGVRVAG